ncbi:MAG: SET domain-containing protein-lysine N-methyltransferase [Gammaproteobacteria bacterium]|nr:SET domain-containing protein-lysine N-methyltransferase [Gammaproteobacteria bacterium]
MVRVKISPQHGKGVFATAAIEAGAEILTFTGPLLQRGQFQHGDYHLQIGDDLYLGASGKADDYVNHSCEPNAGFGKALALVALRDIAKGEEITWDYSTAIDEEDFDGFPCQCGASACRGVVASYRRLGESDRERLAPWLLPYLRLRYSRAALKLAI